MKRGAHLSKLTCLEPLVINLFRVEDVSTIFEALSLHVNLANSPSRDGDTTNDTVTLTHQGRNLKFSTWSCKHVLVDLRMHVAGNCSHESKSTMPQFWR